jgi:membrane peptidoglycan carboxypeptidase
MIHKARCPDIPVQTKQSHLSALTATGGNCLWDYDFRYPGAIDLRYALGGSRNVPAVKAMLETLARIRLLRQLPV